MSRPPATSNRSTKSSFLRQNSFTPLSTISDLAFSDHTSTKSILKKKLKSSRPSSPTNDRNTTSFDQKPAVAENKRPSVLRKGSGRPSSIFGSFRNFRLQDDDAVAKSAAEKTAIPAAPTRKGSGTTGGKATTGEKSNDIGRSRNVILHGEAQTHSSLFWKKKEYLVLTESHLLRFKSQGKASESFPSIPPTSRAGSMKSAPSPLIGSFQDSHSDHSGDMAAGIPLEQVVAVYQPEDLRQSTSLDVSYLDKDSGQGTTLAMQFLYTEERDTWSTAIRTAADRARLLDTDPIQIRQAEYAARVVEREQDYDVSNFTIYKVVMRGATRTSGRSSTDETSKASATVGFLVIGMHKVHLIPLPKTTGRFSSPSLVELNDGGSFGILSLTRVAVNPIDDSFSLTFRIPCQPAEVFQLASLAASEVALRLYQLERFLRPGWQQRPFKLQLPQDRQTAGHLEIEDIESQPEDGEDTFDRTLISYCVAYNINPSVIRYSVNNEVEDSPRFELLASASTVPRPYSNLELLAVLRSLRYNSDFNSASFARINLDGLANAYDRYGSEHICTQSADGISLSVSLDEQKRSPVLMQELRALASTNPKLRRLDFSFCLSVKRPLNSADPEASPTGCGIVEALYPLCKKQLTAVDWIALNGIALDEADLDYLAGMAADRACHLRAIEVSRCGLTDRGITLLLDAFRSQTALEAIDLSSNTLRLIPSTLSRQLGAFNHIRKIDLSHLAVETGADPLIPFDILSTWRLEDLRLKGISLNAASVMALCKYLTHPQSEVLYEVMLSNCSLNGRDAANLMESMTQEPGIARFLHLDIGENRLHLYHERLVGAIARNLAPTHLSMRTIEYDRDEQFRELLLALGSNQSIRYLDLSKLSLPHEAGEESCQALERFLGENNTVTELDISGEESRLEVSHFGVGLNQALNGLKHNAALTVLRIQHQALGLQGASTLAEVLKSNEVLRELHCDHNGISLTGFTDLISSLSTNKTLLYLPSLEEGRDAAIKQTQEQIKLARTKTDGTLQHSPKLRRTFGSFGGNGDGVRTPPKVAPVPQWTEQDVQAALRLVRQGWEGQVHRLDTYLERNWKIYHGMPLEEAEEELSEIPKGGRGDMHSINDASTVNGNSLAAIFETVAMETTPTMEKQSRLGHDDDGSATVKKPSSSSSRPPMLLPDLDFEQGRSLLQGNIFGIGIGGELPGLASSPVEEEFTTAPGRDEEETDLQQISPVIGAEDDGGEDNNDDDDMEDEEEDEDDDDERDDDDFTMPMKRLDSASTVRNNNAGGGASRLTISLAEYQSRVLNLSPTKAGGGGGGGGGGGSAAAPATSAAPAFGEGGMSPPRNK